MSRCLSASGISKDAGGLGGSETLRKKVRWCCSPAELELALALECEGWNWATRQKVVLETLCACRLCACRVQSRWDNGSPSAECRFLGGGFTRSKNFGDRSAGKKRVRSKRACRKKDGSWRPKSNDALNQTLTTQQQIINWHDENHVYTTEIRGGFRPISCRVLKMIDIFTDEKDWNRRVGPLGSSVCRRHLVLFGRRLCGFRPS